MASCEDILVRVAAPTSSAAAAAPSTPTRRWLVGVLPYRQLELRIDGDGGGCAAAPVVYTGGSARVRPPLVRSIALADRPLTSAVRRSLNDSKPCAFTLSVASGGPTTTATLARAVGRAPRPRRDSGCAESARAHRCTNQQRRTATARRGASAAAAAAAARATRRVAQGRRRFHRQRSRRRRHEGSSPPRRCRRRTLASRTATRAHGGHVSSARASAVPTTRCARAEARHASAADSPRTQRRRATPASRSRRRRRASIENSQYATRAAAATRRRTGDSRRGRSGRRQATAADGGVAQMRGRLCTPRRELPPRVARRRRRPAAREGDRMDGGARRVFELEIDARARRSRGLRRRRRRGGGRRRSGCATTAATRRRRVRGGARAAPRGDAPRPAARRSRRRWRRRAHRRAPRERALAAPSRACRLCAARAELRRGVGDGFCVGLRRPVRRGARVRRRRAPHRRQGDRCEAAEAGGATASAAATRRPAVGHCGGGADGGRATQPLTSCGRHRDAVAEFGGGPHRGFSVRNFSIGSESGVTVAGSVHGTH